MKSLAMVSHTCNLNNRGGGGRQVDLVELEGNQGHKDCLKDTTQHTATEQDELVISASNGQIFHCGEFTVFAEIMLNSLSKETS